MERDHIAYALAAAYKRGWIEGVISMPIEESESTDPYFAEIKVYADARWEKWVAAANQARSFQELEGIMNEIETILTRIENYKTHGMIGHVGKCLLDDCAALICRLNNEKFTSDVLDHTDCDHMGGDCVHER